MKIRYCSNCILPNTRPNIYFNSVGICDGCESSKQKQETIDWSLREMTFSQLAEETKRKNRNYDCLIPVSGGKDSTWQVIKALEYNLNPLCVTWKTPARNSLGASNLENLIDLGVNHIDFTINPNVEKRFTLIAFKRFGIPLIPMHMAMHAISLQVAINYNIPLIIWGENSAFEYGGKDKNLKGFQLNHSWLKNYGVTNGTTSKDWISDNLTEKDLAPYYWPSDKEQIASGIKAVFLGHYFEWDPIQTYKIAKSHGFKAGEKPKTGYYVFADIDDSFLITIHHWLKWYKFGFSRLWDNLSIEIRNERITRKEAIEIVIEVGEELPKDEIEGFCNYVGISEESFFEIAEKFRNHEIWKRDKENNWYINNYLIENWKWHK